MTEQEVQADLESKVYTLFEPLMQSVIESLNRLRLSGSGIVQDHMRNECNYLVPKAFMSAVLEEKGRRYKGFTQESKTLRRQYIDLM
jgi:hypothetical protein